MQKLKEKVDLVISSLKQGKMIIIVDDKDRENEGDIAIAGEKITGESVNFMIKECRGLVCVAMTPKRLKQLELPQMVKDNQDNKKTKFSVSVDHSDCETGISAFERAKTIKALSDDNALPTDFKRPGHIFPLESNPEGIFGRSGHTEAIIELLEMAELKSVGVICEIIKDNGRMARGKDLEKFSNKFDLPMIQINEIKKYLKEYF